MAIACTAALAQIRGALPEDEGAELSVPVRFWWWQPNVAQEMARMMPAPRWEDLTANYSQRTLESLEPLMSWRAVPPRAGRLLLWHGAPGTGKPTAVRSLARQWRYTRRRRGRRQPQAAHRRRAARPPSA
ncbi:MAG: DUF5925 domain-containing protein [Solirubrobacteraceae bacterium]